MLHFVISPLKDHRIISFKDRLGWIFVKFICIQNRFYTSTNLLENNATFEVVFLLFCYLVIQKSQIYFPRKGSSPA